MCSFMHVTSCGFHIELQPIFVLAEKEMKMGLISIQ